MDVIEAQSNNDIFKIILIEDSALLRELVTEELNAINQAEVVAYAEGEDEALCEIESHQPDLVIVDIELKQGDGIGVLEKIQNNPGIYNVQYKFVYTNHTSPKLKRHCYSFGIDGYYDKSYQLDELISCVEELIIN